MDNFSFDSCVEVLHGVFYSVFEDPQGLFWVAPPSLPSVYAGPYDFHDARYIMECTNFTYNYLKMKGVFFNE